MIVLALVALILFALGADQVPSPDAVSGFGGTGIAAFAAWQFARLVSMVSKFLEKLGDHMEVEAAARKAEAKARAEEARHRLAEAEHHETVEALLVHAVSAGAPGRN